MVKETELIKERLDLVEFIRSYLTLQPAGKNFKALCPFHQEKTPSFIVSPERKMWHCFGCQVGGDIIKFLMLHENLEFPEALQVLAEKAGIELKRINPGQQKEVNVLYDIHESAKQFFKEELIKNKEAIDYLKERGLEGLTVKEFEVGFAPGGETLILYLLNLGYDMDSIVRAGLALKNSQGLHRDRFFNRIIFPIFNHFGKISAFTGRILPSVQGEVAKYLNSPDTLIFNKSKILYGLNNSKSEIIKAGSVFLVEGQLDLLMAWQAGVKNVVAVSGSALSQDHLYKLRRLTDTILLSFDNDESGLKALERSLDILVDFDFHIKVVHLERFKDPADAVKEDPAFLKQAVDKAVPAFIYLFNAYWPASEEIPDVISQKRILCHLLSKIKQVKSAVEQQAWLKELAKHSGVSETALAVELDSLSTAKISTNEPVETTNQVIKTDRINLISERLILLALTYDDFFSILKKHRKYFPEALKAVINKPADAADLLKLRSSYEIKDYNIDNAKHEFEELLKYLKVEFLKKKNLELKQEIKLAQEQGNDRVLASKLKDFNNITKEINQLSQKNDDS